MQRFYSINEALLTNKKVQIIDKNKFVIVILDVNSKIFIIYLIIKKQEEITIYFYKKTQIKVLGKAKVVFENKVYVKALLFNKFFINICSKYSNYSNIF